MQYKGETIEEPPPIHQPAASMDGHPPSTSMRPLISNVRCSKATHREAPGPGNVRNGRGGHGGQDGLVWVCYGPVMDL